MLVNEKGKVMEIEGGADRENSNIACNDPKNAMMSQQFKIIYVDEVPSAPKKGDFIKNWGLKNLEPFFL